MNQQLSPVVSRSATEAPEGGTPATLPTIPTKRCCGVLAGDYCDCAEFAAQARGVFDRAIMCRPASQWGA